jgi:hypothetical protein
MARRLGPLVFVALAIGAILLARRARGHVAGRETPGGILIADPGAYDTHSRLIPAVRRLAATRSLGQG